MFGPIYKLFNEILLTDEIQKERVMRFLTAVTTKTKFLLCKSNVCILRAKSNVVSHLTYNWKASVHFSSTKTSSRPKYRYWKNKTKHTEAHCMGVRPPNKIKMVKRSCSVRYSRWKFLLVSELGNNVLNHPHAQAVKDYDCITTFVDRLTSK